MRNDRFLKCFAGTFSSTPDMEKGIDITDWDTADAKVVDLAYLAESHHFTLGLISSFFALFMLI